MVDLFAGICVSDPETARGFRSGCSARSRASSRTRPSACGSLASTASCSSWRNGGRGGRATITLFVDDLDALLEGIASRGVEPAERETYSNGVRKATYRDPDGNEIGYGGSPAG